MKLRNGFAPFFILLILGAIITTGTIGYSYLHRYVENKNKIVESEHPSFLQPTESLPSPIVISPTSIPKIVVQPTVLPTVANVYVSINDNGNPILDNALWLHVMNENTQEEKLLQNTSSSWKIVDIKPGKYKITIPFSYKKYFNPDRSCEGCNAKEDKSDFEICGYVINIVAGDNIKISCSLRSTHPLPIANTNPNQPIPPDSSPPAVDIAGHWGQTYGQSPTNSYCFLMKGNDDVLTTDAEFSYRSKIDQNSWSDWNHNPYPCYENLSNGSHVFSGEVMDKSGKISDEKSLSFTVK